MPNGIPFEVALEYMRIAFDEKSKDLERDFIGLKVDLGSQVQTIRRDNRQAVEKQYEFEKGIDRRIMAIEAAVRWIKGATSTIAIAALVALAIKVLGL